uniref:Tomoregulin-1 n=1 Tax=Eptatretus burgeri TaxID=7764 RepID=A0A8C4Q6X1_EPTBU
MSIPIPHPISTPTPFHLPCAPPILSPPSIHHPSLRFQQLALLLNPPTRVGPRLPPHPPSHPVDPRKIRRPAARCAPRTGSCERIPAGMGSSESWLGAPRSRLVLLTLLTLSAAASTGSSSRCRGRGCLDFGEKDYSQGCDFSTCQFGGQCLEMGAELVCHCKPECPDDYKPVCGSSGDTFQNECFMRLMECREQLDIHVVTDGPCYADYEASGIQNQYQPNSCSRCKFEAECDEDAEDVECVCNIDCTGSNYNPVCASDGISYDNPCLVREASCLKQESIDVMLLGKCHVDFPMRKVQDFPLYRPEMKGRAPPEHEEPFKSNVHTKCPENFQAYCLHGTCGYTYSQHKATCKCDSGFTGLRCEKELNILYVIPSGEKLHYVLIAAIVGAVQIAVIIAVVICVVRKCGKRKRGRMTKHSLGHFSSDCGPAGSSLMV